MNWYRAAGLIGASGILAAAYGAHGLERVAIEGGMRWWAIACGIQLVTAPAVLLVATLINRSAIEGTSDSGSRATRWSGWLFLSGLVLFCGTLYAMTLGAPRVLGAITPLGGLSLTAAWLLLSVRR